MFTITVDDGNGGTDTQDVTILVTGSNDAPVITPVDVAGALPKAVRVSEAGSITFTDLDLTDRPNRHGSDVFRHDCPDVDARTAGRAGECLHDFSAAGGNTNNGTINWDYTIPTATSTSSRPAKPSRWCSRSPSMTATAAPTPRTSRWISSPVRSTTRRSSPRSTSPATITEGGTVSEAGAITFNWDLDLDRPPDGDRGDLVGHDRPDA